MSGLVEMPRIDVLELARIVEVPEFHPEYRVLLSHDLAIG